MAVETSCADSGEQQRWSAWSTLHSHLDGHGAVDGRIWRWRGENERFDVAGEKNMGVKSRKSPPPKWHSHHSSHLTSQLRTCIVKIHGIVARRRRTELSR